MYVITVTKLLNIKRKLRGFVHFFFWGWQDQSENTFWDWKFKLWLISQKKMPNHFLERYLSKEKMLRSDLSPFLEGDLSHSEKTFGNQITIVLIQLINLQEGLYLQKILQNVWQHCHFVWNFEKLVDFDLMINPQNQFQMAK